MMNTQIFIRDVTARDGIQNETPLSVEQRVELVNRLLAAGVTSLEVGSFVNPKVIPAMANTSEVFAGVEKQPDVIYWALVPNKKGAQMAVEAGVSALSITASASETYGTKNVGRSVQEAIEECEKIANVDGVSGKPIDAVISCSFGSPWEGDIPPTEVATLAKSFLNAGATQITLADTTGMATPRLIMSVLNEVGTDVGLHLHDTRGTALVNAVAAISAGARRFDTSVGAIGGSPFAVDAGGNLGTEDLCHLMKDFCMETAIDFDQLLQINQWLASALGHPLNSRVGEHGPRWKQT